MKKFINPLDTMTLDELLKLKRSTENARNDAESSMKKWYDSDLNEIDLRIQKFL